MSENKSTGILFCRPFNGCVRFNGPNGQDIWNAKAPYGLEFEGRGGRLDGLQLLFQVNNLTNEPYVAYSQDRVRVMDYQEYGTQYLLGLNYRF